MLISGSPKTAPKWKHNKRSEDNQTFENLPANERTDLLILGMIRDEKEKKFHKAHQVGLIRSVAGACRLRGRTLMEASKLLYS